MAEAKTALAPFEPTNLTEAIDLSNKIAVASLLPAALRNKPADVLISIMAGRELGLSPMQSLRSMHVVQGRPVMSADLMVGLCVRQRDLCEYFQLIESTAEVATYETKRVGHRSPTRMSFTFEQAKRAGLTGKDNWKNYPDAMLRARASAALSRAVYPDLLAGVYEQSEVGPGQPLGAVPSIDAEFSKSEPDPTTPAVPEAKSAAQITADDAVLAGIDVAKSQADLDALVPECAALREPGRSVVRARWVQKLKEVTAQTNGVQAGAAT